MRIQYAFDLLRVEKDDLQYVLDSYEEKVKTGELTFAQKRARLRYSHQKGDIELALKTLEDYYIN